jgi:glycosyltransferase involved in cell wall biosynthesis
VALVPNAVNRRMFDRRLAHARPADLPPGSPQILYIGALWGEWFDWGLVRAVAEAHPQAAVTMIGDYAGQCPYAPPANLRFLGLKAQTELPAYLAHADVALIPFEVSPLTQAVSPLKVFEYLAMGVPVVSTPLVELTGMPHVHLADGPAAFAAAVGRAAAEPRDEAKLAAFARANGWEARVDALLAALLAPPGSSGPCGPSALSGPSAP